jgi:hypothetical protein
MLQKQKLYIELIAVIYVLPITKSVWCIKELQEQGKDNEYCVTTGIKD